MAIQVLIAHDEDEEVYAEQLAGPIQQAGYEVVHFGTVMVGESLIEEASKVLRADGPVVLCGTIAAIGTGWAGMFVNAARHNNRGVQVFPVRMQKKANVEQLSLGGKIAEYWQDPAKAMQELISSLEKHYPLYADAERRHTNWDCYKQAVFEEHQWVRLAVIASAKHASFTRIPLTEVFVPQMGEAGQPNYDIPDEVLEYKRRLFGLDKLPDTSEDMISLEEVTEIEAGTEDLGVLGGTSPELVFNVLMRERTQVFLGGPGSGKSTLLHYTLLVLCDPQQSRETLPSHLQSSPVPFLIELRQYLLKKIPDFIEYIVENTKERYAGVHIDAENLRSLFYKEGQALVAFDGLDEVFDPNDRARVIQSFRAFARQYRTHIVVTSRIVGYEGSELGVAQFRHYTLLDFNLQQMRQFVTKWYQYYTWKGEERNAQGLIQRITENPRLMELAGNPLLLTMMAVIYKHGNLPERRWELYKRCTEVLLEDWEIKGKGIDYRTSLRLEINIRAPQKAEILQRVSTYMLEHGQKERELNAIAYQPLTMILVKYLKEKYNQSEGEAEAIAQDILQHLRERTYILAEVGEGIFGFVHRTFMEYFAACYWQAEFNAKKSDYQWLKVEVFGKHWQQDTWQEVLLLLIAMLSGQKSPVKEVVEYLRTEYRQRIPLNVAFAARCLAETETVEDQQWAQSLLTELVEGISRYAAQPKRKEVEAFLETALSVFSMLAPMLHIPQQVKERINRLRESRNVRVRVSAWRMDLAHRSQQERLKFAIAALQDREEAVCREAIAAVEREWPGQDEVGQLLIETVQTDRFPTVRQAALETLQRAWSERKDILDAIECRVEKESSYTYIAWLIQYLAANWRDYQRTFDIVVKLVNRMKVTLTQKTSYEPNIRKAVAEAIGYHWGGDSRILALLNDWVKDTNPYIRGTALEAIGQGWRGDPEILAYLKDLAIKDADPAFRLATLKQIVWGWWEAPETLELLKDLLVKDADAGIRWTIARVIAQTQWRDPKISPVLKDIAVDIKNADANVRLEALKEVIRGWWRGPETLALLKDVVIKDVDPDIRLAATRAIVQGWRENSETLALLKDVVIKDVDPDIREAGIWNIEAYKRSNPEILALFKDMAAKDANPGVRKAAIKALGRGWQGNVEILALFKDAAVKDTDISVRRAAIKTLEEVWLENHRNVVQQSNEATSTLDVD